MLLKIFFSLFKCMRAIVCFACLLAWRLVRAYILASGEPQFFEEDRKIEAERRRRHEEDSSALNNFLLNKSFK